MTPRHSTFLPFFKNCTLDKGLPVKERASLVPANAYNSDPSGISQNKVILLILVGRAVMCICRTTRLKYFLLLQQSTRLRYPVLGSLVQKRQSSPGESPVEGHKDDKGPGASPL